ncbi:MAG: hypothetical protein V2J25_07965 [Desulfatiglans sp.]|jgi:hypothetical protein|nr:hypothetical protein [Thermodesulfobacteriota bacterium]MEE4352788.1 hypothetical protein [Desulfatiglans sp.]
MRKFSLIAVALCLLAFVVVGNARAEGNNIGLGYQNMVAGELLQGISLRGWVDKIMWEGTIFYGDAEVEIENQSLLDADMWLLEAKGAYSLIQKPNSDFYVGMSLAYGTASVDLYEGSMDVDIDVLAFGPMFGVEYRFQGIPELGFNFETGYKFTDMDLEEADIDTDDIEISLNGVYVVVGLHYYF